MRNNIIKRIYVLFISFVLIFTTYIFAFLNTNNVFAEEITYADILESDINNYPIDNEDLNIDVIQIWETSENQLKILVYQPSCETYNFRATSINVFTGDSVIDLNNADNNIDNRLYELEYIKHENQFYEYLVKDYTVSTAKIHYFGIDTIYRTLKDGETSDVSSSGQVLREKGYPVAKCWSVIIVNDEKTYLMEETEIIEIVNPICGFVRYSGGHSFLWGQRDSCDSHFVAFDTDLPIDDLVEAQLSYKTTSYDYSRTGVACREEITLGNTVSHNGMFVSNTDDPVSFNNVGWFNRINDTYTWNRIERTSTFISNLTNTSNVYTGLLLNANAERKYTVNQGSLEDFSNTEWVLRFYESNYHYNSSRVEGVVGYTDVEESQTLVSDVTILRLKYIYDGQTYNLGAVMDKFDESKDPTIGVDTEIDIEISPKIKEAGNTFLKILGIIGAVILICFAWKIFSFLFLPRIKSNHYKRRKRKK